MTYLATITSKRQFTIPIELFKLAKLKANQKVMLTLEEPDFGIFKFQPAGNIVDKLAGSITVPKKYRGRDIDEMIKEAKVKRFSKGI